MGISEVLQLICGLALFLYGMEVMGESLKKSAGSSLKTILGKMTSNPFKGFLLGLGVTCVIQSSSATTVMVVGFVNSGTMTLLQSVGVIMGANVGTAVTAWLTALSGLGGDEGADAVAALEWLKPDAWMPILALIGICLVMFVKRGKKRDIGAVLLGFAVLMTGMDIMSSSVSGLKSDEGFKAILTMFDNPILGVLAGLILTAIVQSSSASVGILQSLTVTGAITYGAAIPIVMGQNIGTCVTALISSIGANKNGRRAAVIHLYFNIIGVAIWLSLFYLFNSLIIPGGFPFVDKPTNMWDIAIIHTVFKILSVIAIAPFYKLLEKLSRLTIKDDPAEQESANLLDERLFETPSVAVGRATEVTASMAEISCKAMVDAMSLFDSFDLKLADCIRDLETKADVYEDTLGTYLVKLSARDLSDRDSKQVTKLLHIIGDLERISDHAVNILESAEEMKEKKIEFSAEAKRELSVLRAAVKETIDLTERSFKTNDVNLAANIEPLEQVVDDLKDTIKRNHIIRLQKSECSIEHGFILADLLNNFERVSDHCSNIGGCVIEISSFDAMDLHKYLANIKQGSKVYEEKYKEYKATYSIVG
ncbi:MAG: Na/Pi cotransporter family protein [Clostridia bacterium]|nr:Na/Pi cotransporter family protein [Clostridia bacterium]